MIFVCFLFLLAGESKVRAWVLLIFVLGTKEMFIGSKATSLQPSASSHLFPYYRSVFWHVIQKEKFAAALLLGLPGSCSSSRLPSTLFFPISCPQQMTCLFTTHSFEIALYFSYPDSLNKHTSWRRNISKVSHILWISVPFNWSSICNVEIDRECNLNVPR